MYAKGDGEAALSEFKRTGSATLTVITPTTRWGHDPLGEQGQREPPVLGRDCGWRRKEASDGDGDDDPDPYAGKSRVPTRLCKSQLSKGYGVNTDGKERKEPHRHLIEERGIKDMEGVHAPVKELTAGLIQACMDAELEEELGCGRYDDKNKCADNSRNGSYSKTVSSTVRGCEMGVRKIDYASPRFSSADTFV